MMRAHLFALFLLIGCVKPQQPTPVAIAPDQETVRKIRELSMEAQIAEQPKAAELTAILLRARIQLWAIANASGDEKALIYAAEAAAALTVCTGERNDECDAAIGAQLQKDLKEIEQGKDTKTVQEIAPLLHAMQRLSAKDPDGMRDLRKLADEDSWRGTAARLFALGRLTETWSAAAQGSTVKVLSTLRNVASLACAAGTLELCAPKTTLWTRDSAEAIAFANTIAALLQKFAAETDDFAKTAQGYTMRELERRAALVLPLPPPNTLPDLPVAERWTNAALAFPQSAKSDAIPRFYLLLQRGAVRFGLPPSIKIVDKKATLLEDSLGLSYPGKELDKTDIAKGISAQVSAVQASIDPSYGEQLKTSKAIAIFSNAETTIGEVGALIAPLSSLSFSTALLMVSPKQAPTKDELVFGAAIPLSLGGSNADTITLSEDGSYQANIGGVMTKYATRDALLADAAKFTKAPTFIAPADTKLSQVVGLYDALRVATRSAWGTFERAPLSIN